eukprot:COSAG02_NODE_21454_length_787_cov_1.190407_1_plen_204_part_00
MEVTWDCRIAHNGRTCEILLAEGATDTTQGQDGGFTSLTGEFECCTQVREESRTVTVPAGAAAGAAVLEWTWAGDGPYFGCTDMTIQAAADGGGGGGNDNIDTEGGGNFSGGASNEDKKNAAIVLVAVVVVFYVYCNYCRGGGGGGGGGGKGGAGLPPGWEEVYDPASGGYYYEHTSGVTQWEPPMADPGYGARAPPPMPARY